MSARIGLSAASEKSREFCAEPVGVWNRLPAEWADITCQVKPEDRRTEPLFNITRTALGPLKARVRIWIYSTPSDKENRIKITRIYCRLTPCFRRHFAMFGDSFQLRAWCSIVQMNGWNITQRAASHCDVIIGSVTSSMHSHDKTNEHPLSYRWANNAIERCQSNCRK